MNAEKRKEQLINYLKDFYPKLPCYTRRLFFDPLYHLDSGQIDDKHFRSFFIRANVLKPNDREMDEIIELAREYIQNSFCDKTETYNESFCGEILNNLDLLGISYSKINVEEMKRCLKIVMQKQERLYKDIEINGIKNNLLYDLKTWISYIEGDISNEPLDRSLCDDCYSLLSKVISAFENVLKNNGEVETLEDAIKQIKLEIQRVNKKYTEKDNYKFNIQYDYIPDDDLPHNRIHEFIKQFILPNLQFLKTHEYQFYDMIEMWENLKKQHVYPYILADVDACTFYSKLIENMSNLIDMLDDLNQYESMLKSIDMFDVLGQRDKESFTNEYYRLFGHFCECVNKSLDDVKIKTINKPKQLIP